MGNTSFGGRARCDGRSVPGNVSVGTSPSAGPTELCSRAGSARAWHRRGRHGFSSCWAQCGRPSQRRMARQEPLALLGLPLRGPSGAAARLLAYGGRSWSCCGFPSGGPQQLHLNIDDVASPDAQVRALLPHCPALRPRSPACPPARRLLG
eukprot:scaffold4450_cov113-Isochrysis_galbana.AAC.8